MKEDDFGKGFMFGVLMGLVIAMFAAMMATWWGDSLAQRCDAACAPMVGDDQGECMCGTPDGWRPLREARL